MKDTRDMRDPQKLGEALHKLRRDYTTTRKALVGDFRRPDLSWIVNYYPEMLDAVPDYEDGGVMSADPALHHSKTKQDAPVEAA